MSDAKDEVDCESVVHELHTFLDGELSDGRRIQITHHLTGCIDCHEVVDFHAELKIVISQKCREQVPDALRERIFKSLQLPE